MGPVLRVVYRTCDIRRCVMDASPAGESVTGAFLLPYRQGKAGLVSFKIEISIIFPMIDSHTFFKPRASPGAVVPASPRRCL